jgi:hypothetical protein
MLLNLTSASTVASSLAAVRPASAVYQRSCHIVISEFECPDDVAQYASLAASSADLLAEAEGRLPVRCDMLVYSKSSCHNVTHSAAVRSATAAAGIRLSCTELPNVGETEPTEHRDSPLRAEQQRTNSSTSQHAAGREQNSFAYYAASYYDRYPERVVFVAAGSDPHDDRLQILTYGLQTAVSFVCAFDGGNLPTSPFATSRDQLGLGLGLGLCLGFVLGVGLVWLDRNVNEKPPVWRNSIRNAFRTCFGLFLGLSLGLGLGLGFGLRREPDPAASLMPFSFDFNAAGAPALGGPQGCYCNTGNGTSCMWFALDAADDAGCGCATLPPV